MSRVREQFDGQRWLVVGLGVTGVSAANWLVGQGATVTAADSRAQPPGADKLHSAVVVRAGELPNALLGGVDGVVASPGLPADLPLFQHAVARGIDVCTDIELFARVVDAPVIGVTGSNGKSTVVTVLGEMAEAAAVNVAVGGNLGTPALDLLAAGADLYVLEISSFQLEWTRSLRCVAATVLNISADHIDRHGSIERYAAIKANLLQQAELAVKNSDDPRVAAMPASNAVHFAAAGAEWHLAGEGGDTALCRNGKHLLRAAAMKVVGKHNQLNALAALALGDAAGLPMPAMLQALREFRGLPHRCEWVAEQGGVTWINDSKGTNVGATLAALDGLNGPIVLLAGGLAKGGDFRPWAPVLAQKGRAALLFGADAERIEVHLEQVLPIERLSTLEQGVERAAALSQAGDTVLLSPGCASMDQFDNYMARGDAFVAAVQQVTAC